MIDTRGYFRPLTGECVALLRSLPAADWTKPTSARAWQVRDVVAHLTDTAFRRVSFHRDGHVPPAPPADLAFVTFINRTNADWVTAMHRASARVLVDLYEMAAAGLCDWIEQLALDAPPLFPVSWAGEDGDQGWLDIGREFTEQWHHQMQIRDAVGRPLDGHPEWLHAVIDVALHGLPHAYRSVAAPIGAAVQFSVAGSAGGDWWLTREPDRWRLTRVPVPQPVAAVVMSDDTAWRLLFNGLPDDTAQRGLIRWTGDATLARPILRARSVIV